MGPARHLVICAREAGSGYLLYYCDEDFQPITDTWHETLADAKAQAEFEYAGITRSWLRQE